MSESESRPSRRSVVRGAFGYGAAFAGAMSGSGRGGDGFNLVSEARAQSFTGVRANNGDLVSIKATEAITAQLAEWVDANSRPGANRIAESDAARERAPANASRYESKLYNFPSGSLRTLTFKRGTPVFHQITFESQIYVLQGTATLKPLDGLSGEPVTIKAGDALFLPSGILESDNTAEDFKILQSFVGNTSDNPKSSIVTAEQARSYDTAQWQVDGKEFNVRTPDDFKNVPANATRWSSKRYEFDGNSIRVASFQKGGRSNTGTTQRRDVLIYIAKGHFRRQEGDHMLDLVEGDVIREKVGNRAIGNRSDSVFIATDAPIGTEKPNRGWTADLNKASAKGTTLFEMSIDHNNRSCIGVLDIPMHKVGENESISAKQDAVHFRIGYRPFRPYARTSADYASAGGPFEMHVGGTPHFVARMVGSTENTVQDGGVFRQSAGDFVYVRPGSLHHSNQVGYVPGVVMNVVLPGTELDTQPLAIKK